MITAEGPYPLHNYMKKMDTLRVSLIWRNLDTNAHCARPGGGLAAIHHSKKHPYWHPGAMRVCLDSVIAVLAHSLLLC